MMKAIGVLDPDYPEKSEKITPDLQKSMDEYIKQIEEIRKNIPKS